MAVASYYRKRVVVYNYTCDRIRVDGHGCNNRNGGYMTVSVNIPTIADNV